MEKYVKPTLEVINLVQEQSLLAASGGHSTYSLWIDDDYCADDDDQ